MAGFAKTGCNSSYLTMCDIFASPNHKPRFTRSPPLMNRFCRLDRLMTARFRRLTEGATGHGDACRRTVQQSRPVPIWEKSMLARLVKVLMLSAAVLAGGPLAGSCSAQAITAAQKAPAKLTAAQILDRQGVAVTVISKSYTALPKESRGRSAPFLKGLIDVANAYRDVAVASKARDNRKMGAALPKVATALAKLDSAYQLSGIRDQHIADSLKSLNVLWKTYLKVVDVGASRKSGKQSATSARKISHMRHELMRRGESQKGDRRAAAQRAHLLALLKEADAASRQADQLWYASMLMAEVYGYYAGAYEYYAAYEPTYAADYRESWQSISSETEYFYSESVSYYEEYSWTSYEETVEVSDSYEFGLTEEEFTAAQTEVETSGVSVGAEAESLYQSSDERQTLDSVETEIDTEESAATEAPAPDAVAPDTEADQPADANEAPKTDGDTANQPDRAGQGADEALPGDDSCAADNPSQDCATTPADDGTAQDEAVPDEQSKDEATPDEANPDEQPRDEASPDDSGVSDDNANASDEGSDACAGDNPPADCFSSDEGAAGDDGAASDEGASSDEGGGDQSYEEPAQDNSAVEEDSSGGDDSGGGEDSSGGDDSGGGGDDE
ncbi:hypothetical protein [Pleomorphomonas sp. PLEO]|uniref:hypothetical protein n=1 Tax=Pleomorphomonas sp. PLEO TaxID=3239306 RepID=UPI00351F0D57